MASGGDVTLGGLTIGHGMAADKGGGILNDGSNLTLSGVVLAQNTVVGAPRAAPEAAGFIAWPAT